MSRADHQDVLVFDRFVLRVHVAEHLLEVHADARQRFDEAVLSDLDVLVFLVRESVRFSRAGT